MNESVTATPQATGPRALISAMMFFSPFTSPYSLIAYFLGDLTALHPPWRVWSHNLFFFLSSVARCGTYIMLAILTLPLRSTMMLVPCFAPCILRFCGVVFGEVRGTSDEDNSIKLCCLPEPSQDSRLICDTSLSKPLECQEMISWTDQAFQSYWSALCFAHHPHNFLHCHTKACVAGTTQFLAIRPCA